MARKTPKGKTKALKKGRSASREGLMPEIDAELAKLESKISEFKSHVVKPPKSVKPVDLHPEIDLTVEKAISKAEQKPVISATGVEKELKDELDAVEREVKVAEKGVEHELVRDERILRKEWRMPDNMGSLTFYFLSSILCIGILAFFFGTTTSFIFYTLFGIILWWWSHQIHKAGDSFLKAFLSKGSVIILLYLAYWVFDDLLSLIVCIMYSLSFFIGSILFLYHTRRDLSEEIHKSFARTLLVVFYAHVMAITAAALVAYMIPFALSDSFVSIIFIILVWLLPSLVVYFFLTKYLYLHFFDRKHWVKDIKKAVGHSLIYSVVLVFIVILAYLLTAMQFAVMEQDSHDDSFGDIFKTLQNSETDIEASPFRYDNHELIGMRISQEVIALADQEYRNATRAKANLWASSLSFWDYLSDNYFTLLARDRMVVSQAWTRAEQIGELKDDLFREYERMDSQADEGLFDDGTSTIDDHGQALAYYLSDNYAPYIASDDISDMETRIQDNYGSYSGLVEDGELLDFNRGYVEDMGLLGPGRSVFSRQFYDMFYHTIIFRDLMVLSFSTMEFHIGETVLPSTVRAIFVDADESLRSRILRYRIVKANLDATLSISEGGDTDKVDVMDKVDELITDTEMGEVE